MGNRKIQEKLNLICDNTSISADSVCSYGKYSINGKLMYISSENQYKFAFLKSESGK